MIRKEAEKIFMRLGAGEKVQLHEIEINSSSTLRNYLFDFKRELGPTLFPHRAERFKRVPAVDSDGIRIPFHITLSWPRKDEFFAPSGQVGIECDTMIQDEIEINQVKLT